MDPVTVMLVAPALVGGGIISAALAVAAGARRRRRLAWQQAAVAAGLTGIEDEGPARVVARAGLLNVTLEAYHLQLDRGTRIVVGGLDLAQAPWELALHPAGPRGRGRGTDGPRTGDSRFDEAVHVEGAPELVHGLLDAPTRRLVLGLTRAGARLALENGQLRMEVPEEHPGHRSAALLPELVELGKRLRRLSPEELAERMAASAASDPDPRVREQSLLALRHSFPRRPGTSTTLRGALQDPDPAVRLQAALVLGEDGRSTLVDLATREGVRDEAAARAIHAAGGHLAAETVQRRLAAALANGFPAVARACIEWLGVRGGAEAVPTLAAVLRSGDGEVAALAAQALSAAGGAAAEAPLIEAVGAGGGHAKTLAAAQALGRVGSAAAVMPLRDAAARLEDGDVGRAVRRAVAEIQARLEGAAPGQLSLSAGGTGQLSLAGEDPRGRLSPTRRGGDEG
jgi:HEAT repeat protein